MKKQIAVIGAALMLALSGCGDDQESSDKPASSHSDSSHAAMNHSSSGEVPVGLKEADNPAFEVGSTAVIQTDHMPGMKGATATISGAFSTTVYAVSYTPTTGGEPVKNHKWVIHEELKDAAVEPYKSGDEVTLEADHMAGMKGAAATIDSAQETTVYMVDYTPTTGGEPVKNHKWVTEDEMSVE
ncbi:YdhK family protein [Paenibacillus lemnae]|uniref:YdhK family protein n=1 Tax=Paenibacillus lemnae TaxID=1330551 RepID=A0A848M372_PAELE|nr:YdhK family protein [Paenibacillus lemnae]NMO94709.1 YdhK family protein [Paenibacillus lemnae]